MNNQPKLNCNCTGHITPEEVRQFDKYKDYTDEQVEDLIKTIKAYVRIIRTLHTNSRENGRIIALNPTNNQSKAA